MPKKNPNYLGYAVKQFGFVDGVSRWWKYEASPMRWSDRARQCIKEYKLVDRRKKCSYSRSTYAVDRDGDMYLIECPQCHRIQSLSVQYRGEAAPCPRCGKHGQTHFHCSFCPIGFSVYLEDGLREILDHRYDNPPNPSKVVRDDQGKYRMGIDTDAPWWWRRCTVYYDYNPENGKDAHGHEPYTVWQISSEWIRFREREEQSQAPPEEEQPQASEKETR